MCDSKLSSQEIFQLRLGGLRYNGDIKQVLAKYSFSHGHNETQLAEEFRYFETQASLSACHEQANANKKPSSLEQTRILDGQQSILNVFDAPNGRKEEAVPDVNPIIHAASQADASRSNTDGVVRLKDGTSYAISNASLINLTHSIYSQRVSLGDSEYRTTFKYAKKALKDHLHSGKSGLMHDLANDSESEDGSCSYEAHKQLWTEARFCIALGRLAYYANQPTPDRQSYGFLHKLKNHYHLQLSLITAMRRALMTLPELPSYIAHWKQSYASNAGFELCELLFESLSVAVEEPNMFPSTLLMFRFAFSIMGFDFVFQYYVLGHSGRVAAVEQVLHKLSSASTACDGDARELANYLNRIRLILNNTHSESGLKT